MSLKISYNTPEEETHSCVGTIVQIGDTSENRVKIKVFVNDVSLIKTFADLRNFIAAVKNSNEEAFTGPVRFNESRLLERYRSSIKH